MIDITTANPPYKVTQETAAAELKKRMSTRPAVSRLIDAAAYHSGIDARYFVVPDGDPASPDKFYYSNGDYIKPGTGARMSEYEKWSTSLAAEAVGKILIDNNINSSEINRLITISCTGFFAPGLDRFLIEKFDLPSSIKRTNIGFMGCAASVIGFNSVLESAAASAEDGYTLMVSVELCSLHLQTEPTRDNILANMIFADGCAASLFSNGSNSEEGEIRPGLISTDSALFKNSENFMGWKIGDFGFEMMLSSELPKIILNEAVPTLKKILQSRGVNKEDIKHWALHPGGKAILNSLKEGLDLSDDEMLASDTVLRNFGNMSSASILFVLKEIIKSGKIKKDELCCAVAFGPGLTMEVALLKGV